MENEVIPVGKDELVPVITPSGLADIIKPLTQEIHLFDSFVAGTTHLKDKSVLGKIEVGNHLTLQREENRYDDNAIVISFNNKKLGYVPEKDNIVFARLMDAGKLLSATISNIEHKGSFTKIQIGIYLVDF